MSRIISFSRKYPSYHSQKGKPTFFIEKLLNATDKHNHWFSQCDKCGWIGASSAMAGGAQIADTGDYDDVCCPKCFSYKMTELNDVVSEEYYLGHFEPKWHTIRKGHRWKVGDKFSPRSWSGTPYKSKTIVLAPDIEIKKIWNFKVECIDDTAKWFINDTCVSDSNKVDWFNAGLIQEIAKNDGLTIEDFLEWFKYPSDFDGQIICWSNKIKY